MSDGFTECKNKAKKIYKKFDVPTNKIYGSYIIQKNIFWSCFGLIILLLFFALLTAPPSTAYFNCANVDGCNNPFYGYCQQDATDCEALKVGYGAYGVKPQGLTFIHKNFFLISALFVGLAFLLNHLKNNVRIKL